MANNHNLKVFKKGHPGGPGRPPNPPELEELKKLTKGQLEVLLNKILNSKPEELKDFKGSVLEAWLSSGVTKGIQQGDFSRLDMLINRLVGKVPDHLDIEVSRKYTDEELLEEHKRRIILIEQRIKERDV